METAKTLSLVFAALGFWETVAPFALRYWNILIATGTAVAVGLAIFALAAVAAGNDDEEIAITIQGLNIFLGLCLTLAPFFEGYTAINRAMWNDVIVGIMLIALSLWTIYCIGRSTARAA